MSETYSQPDFYRFNSDSITLIRYIRELKCNFESIIDLGAGCGILGIEVANAVEAMRLDLVEAQLDFKIHLEKNIKSFLNQSIESNLFIKPFSELDLMSKYDLVISNPPYFLPGDGRRSPDTRRNLARTFDLDNWVILLKLIRNVLKKDGLGLIVLKKDIRANLLLEDLLSNCLLSYQKVIRDNCYVWCLKSLDEDGD